MSLERLDNTFKLTTGTLVPESAIEPIIQSQDNNYFIDNQQNIDNSSDTTEQENVQILGTLNQVEEEMQVMQSSEDYFDYEQYVIDQLQEELDLAQEKLYEQDEQDGFISDIYNGLKELTGLGISKSEVRDAIEKQEETIELLIEAKRTGNFEEVYEQITGNEYDEAKLLQCHQTEEILEGVQAGLEVILNSDESEEIKQQYINEFLLQYQSQAGKSYEQLVGEYKQLSESYLGSSNELTNILNQYIESQENFIDKAANIAQIGGMGMMIVGGIACFIPGGQIIGAGMIKAGQVMAIAGTFGDNALEAVDLATNEKKFSEEKEEYAQLGKETLIDAALFAAGYGAGTAANAIGSQVLNRTSSVVLSKAADIGTDIALSLAGDAAITGEIDLAGEGVSQLLGVLTGSATARLNGAKINTKLDSFINDKFKLGFEGDIKLETPKVGDDVEIPKVKFPTIEPKIISEKINKNTYKQATEVAGEAEFNYIQNNGSIIESKFKQELNPNTLKTITQHKEGIDIDQAVAYGSIASFSQLDEILSTNSLLQCSAISFVSKSNNSQTLLHLCPTVHEPCNTELLKYIMENMFANDLEIGIVPGFYTDTDKTITYAMNKLKEINPNAKITFYNFPNTNGRVILENGELGYIDNKLYKVTDTNPKSKSIIATTTKESFFKDYNFEQFQVNAPKMSFNPETNELLPIKTKNETEIQLEHKVAGDNIGANLKNIETFIPQTSGKDIKITIGKQTKTLEKFDGLQNGRYPTIFTMQDGSKVSFEIEKTDSGYKIIKNNSFKMSLEYTNPGTTKANSKIKNETIKTPNFDGKSKVNLDDYTSIQLAARNFAINQAGKKSTFYDKNRSPEVIYQNAIENTYTNLRCANYKSNDFNPDNIVVFANKSTSAIKVVDQGNWNYRIPVSRNSKNKTVDRISLNVKPNEALIKALDEYFITSGTKGYYKTPQTYGDWNSRHDPITIYLDEPIRQDIINEIVKISQPHIRSDEDVLIGKTVAPGVAIDKSPTEKELETIIQNAEKYDPILANVLKTSSRYGFAKNPSVGDYSLKASAGKVAAVNLLLNELANSQGN